MPPEPVHFQAFRNPSEKWQRELSDVKLAPGLLYTGAEHWKPPMSNVVSLQAAREIREAETEDHAYRAQILGMDKLELLEEMVRFQEERSLLGRLTLPMMIRGRHLFKALEETAETQELKILTRSDRRHLDYELQDYRERQKQQG